MRGGGEGEMTILNASTAILSTVVDHQAEITTVAMSDRPK